jgi:hypothetical protein
MGKSSSSPASYPLSANCIPLHHTILFAEGAQKQLYFLCLLILLFAAVCCNHVLKIRRQQVVVLCPEFCVRKRPCLGSVRHEFKEY